MREIIFVQIVGKTR